MQIEVGKIYQRTTHPDMFAKVVEVSERFVHYYPIADITLTEQGEKQIILSDVSTIELPIDVFRRSYEETSTGKMIGIQLL